MSQAGI